MASVPDWTTDGYSFRGERRSSSRGFVRWITESLRRIAGRSQPAPPVSKSLVYALCEALVHRLHPMNGKRTPDPNTVGLALITAASSPAAPAKKNR